MSSNSLLACVLGPCPECGNGKLDVVSDGHLTNLFCEACGACWHAELDHTRRVDPAICPGCPAVEACAAAQLKRAARAASGGEPAAQERDRGPQVAGTVSVVVDWEMPSAARS